LADRQTPHPQHPHQLTQIDSYVDRLSDWVATHPVATLSLAGAILLGAAGVGAYSHWRASVENEASAALAAVRAEYLVAMGTSPDAIEVPELANPETGEAVRGDFLERFRKVAEETAGTSSQALALIEVGNLQEAGGDAAGAIETWRGAAAALPGDSPLRGLVLQRIAHALEDQGQLREAAETYLEAAELRQYPLRYRAMAEAARTFAGAGDSAKAIELFERVQSEAPELSLPPHVASRLRELVVVRDLARAESVSASP
jgi:hypothetical protein